MCGFLSELLDKRDLQLELTFCTWLNSDKQASDKDSRYSLQSGLRLGPVATFLTTGSNPVGGMKRCVLSVSTPGRPLVERSPTNCRV